MSQGSEGHYHEPVLVGEVVELFLPLRGGVLVDATYGGGGHSKALLDGLAGDVRVLGIDRDPDAVGRVNPHGRLKVVRGNFGAMRAILDAEGIEEVGGVLFDFGVSSHQLDVAERGFSFRQEGPLDMRMGPDTGADAGTLVNEASVEDLARIIARYGEERFAGRIARAIVSGRPIHTTSDLAATVRNAIPAATRRTGGHPARRTFQALRMAVNDELGAIEAGLDQALEALAPGGRCVAISYHSLEDRLVKRRFRAGSTGPDLPGLPVEPQTELRLLTRAPVTPSDDEVIRNPRARSARLRAVEKAV